ncbi:MAG: HlyD family efflux transporter periplasmic adaptor subunit [Oribacterium sp.]|nr:HlyD family efflux transporter periplasmic adaptor subunit [Oribacterium sp.]
MNNEKNQKEIDSSKMFHIIARGDYLLLLALVCMLLALLVWIFKGTIKETVSASGVVNNTHYSTKISLPVNGTVYELYYQVADYVSDGEVIGTVLPEREADNGLDPAEGEDAVKIVSTTSGFITEIYCYEGDRVNKGVPILRITRSDSERVEDAIVLVDAQELGLIREGTPAAITLDAFPEERYGTLSGRVTGIDTRTKSQIRFAHIFGNDTVAASLMDQKGDYTVMIHFDRDENGDFLFSKGSIPAKSIKVNEECKASLLVREEHPYKMIIGE